MTKSRVLLGVLLFMTAGALVQAQEGPALTPAYVEGFIAALPEIQALGKELEMREDFTKPDMKTADGTIPVNPMALVAAAIEKHPEAARFRAIIQKNGFADIMTWGHVGDRIMHAYGAVKVEKESPDMDAKMKEAMDQLDKSDMSAEQKQAMKKMMMAQTKMVGAWTTAPDGDKAVVKQHMAELEKAFEDTSKR